MYKNYVDRILAYARIRHQAHPHWSHAKHPVYVTEGNQIIGSHKALGEFRAGYTEPDKFKNPTRVYKSWESHHIVEENDLDRLRITHLVPPRNHQICVLLPWEAHRKRINARLRHTIPLDMPITREDLWYAYEDAYWALGDYCGGGVRVRKELLAIVKSVVWYA